MRRIFQLIPAVASFLATVPATFANAAWHQCSISAVGYDDGSASVQRIDLDAVAKFTKKCFQLVVDRANRQLTLLPAAQDNRGHVGVNVGLAGGNEPAILGGGVINP